MSEETHLQNTYGKGFKLLQKSGYKVGQGLGKHNQGTTDIITLKKRRKNEGLSYSQSEKQKTLEKPNWFKSEKPFKKKKVSVECMKEQIGKWLSNEPQPTESIIDMRGQEASASLSLLNAGYEEAKSRVIAVEKQLMTEKDVLTQITYEQKVVEKQLTLSKQKAFLIKQVQRKVKAFLEESENLEAILRLFQELHTESPKLFQEMKLKKNFAVPIAKRVFDKYWKNWNFEENPYKGLKEAQSWSKWLEKGMQYLLEHWETSLQRFIFGRWLPKSTKEDLVEHLETWKPTLPSKTWEKVQTWVLQKLTKEVENWEPRQDKIPIHTWLHPWLPLVDLKELFPAITRKLSLVLQEWHPKDPSAKVVLGPWKPVLGEDFNKLMLKSILPKLGFLLSEMEITKDSTTKPMQWVLEWLDFVPFEELQKVMLEEFYPRWKSYLTEWVAQAEDQQLEEVMQWFRKWQSLIPKDLLDLESAFYE